MTNNQIAFWTLEHDKAKTRRAQQETERSNLAKERETERSNLAREAETYRSNVAKEVENHRSNAAKEAETYRSNIARETETNRANVANEFIKSTEVNDKAFSRLGPILGPVVSRIETAAEQGNSGQQKGLGKMLSPTPAEEVPLSPFGEKVAAAIADSLPENSKIFKKKKKGN